MQLGTRREEEIDRSFTCATVLVSNGQVIDENDKRPPVLLRRVENTLDVRLDEVQETEAGCV